jgi:transcriptional regulator with PAS, ATPase and Fis domain
VALLAGYFLDKYSRELGRRPPRLAAETLECLNRHPWPGNVRELQNLMERTDDNKSAAARLLEISERSPWYKLKNYGV